MPVLLYQKHVAGRSGGQLAGYQSLVLAGAVTGKLLPGAVQQGCQLGTGHRAFGTERIVLITIDESFFQGYLHITHRACGNLVGIPEGQLVVHSGFGFCIQLQGFNQKRSGP
ncbi:hypothetical protein D3C81_1950930 [compost metagenome]